jgi:arylformamidase
VRDDAVDLAALALTAFMGECELRDVSGAQHVNSQGVIPASAVLDRLPPRVERLVLRTFATPDWHVWPAGFRALDAPSIDPETCKQLRSHHACHRAGMAILEGVVLDGITEGRYELIALPLPILGIEATPVRAVLREWI